MQAFGLNHPNGQFMQVEIPDPVPRHGQLVIQPLAVGLNNRDRANASMRQMVASPSPAMMLLARLLMQARQILKSASASWHIPITRMPITY